MFFIGFHLTFFIQHFLGLQGMPRRVFTYLGGQGWDTANLVSTIGAFLMGVGTIVFIINIVITVPQSRGCACRSVGRPDAGVDDSFPAAGIQLQTNSAGARLGCIVGGEDGRHERDDAGGAARSDPYAVAVDLAVL